MKRLAILILSFCSLQAVAQNTDILASTGGIGPFKIGMSPKAVEKLLGKQLRLPSTSKPEASYEWDTVKVRYKDLDLTLIFGRAYFAMDTIDRVGVREVQCSNPKVRTKSGIGVGDDKLKIFMTYDQYRLEYYPSWDRKNEPKKAQVNLYDNETPNVLIFYLNEGKVIGFAAMVFEGE